VPSIKPRFSMISTIKIVKFLALVNKMSQETKRDLKKKANLLLDLVVVVAAVLQKLKTIRKWMSLESEDLNRNLEMMEKQLLLTSILQGMVKQVKTKSVWTIIPHQEMTIYNRLEIKEFEEEKKK
jgi:adenylosuccinate lyase